MVLFILLVRYPDTFSFLILSNYYNLNTCLYFAGQLHDNCSFMRFVMYLNEKPVDSISLPGGIIKISQLIEEMKEKHKQLLKTAGTEPVFALESVPSCINDFQSLKAG